MGQIARLVFTTVASLGVSQALAADLLPPPPPPPPPPAEIGGGWYLRGDIGMTNQKVDKVVNPQLDAAFPVARVAFDQSEFASAPFFGLGVGYQFNSYFRVDVTGEYRGRSSYRGTDRVGWLGTPAGTYNQTNDFTGSKTEYVGLLNAYVDLGTWHGITPFIGAGVGFANVSIDNFRDAGQGINPFTGNGFTSLATSGNKSKTNFAWALMAGLGYQVTDNLTLELGYRYINLGDGETGDSVSFNGANAVPDSWKFKDITSHDLKFGMRWALGSETYYEPRHRPLVTKY